MVDGDGCSSNCTQEENYNCTGGSSTVPSVCSYSGPILITISTANKDPSSNSMDVSFSLKPADPLLVLTNGSTDFTSMVSFPGYQITVVSATIDAATGQLQVKFDYFEHLQGLDVTLAITPPDTPQAALVGNLSYNWVVSSDNQLAVLYYT